MMISTKGRYALSIMLDLATHDDGNYISLKDISERLEISMKYLEAIIAKLSKGGLVDSARGKSGGYKLNRKVEEYSVGEILVLTEKHLHPLHALIVTPAKRGILPHQTYVERAERNHYEFPQFQNLGGFVVKTKDYHKKLIILCFLIYKCNKKYKYGL